MDAVENTSERVIPNTLTLGILSRGRLPQLRECINSALALANASIRVVVAFDDDVAGYLYMPEYAGCSKHLLRPRRYYVNGINTLGGVMAATASQDNPLDVFCLVNNDVLFTSGDWVKHAIEQLFLAFPDGMGILSLDHEDDKCANYVSRKKFFDEHCDGYLGWPGYTCYCSDTEVMDIAKKLGRYRTIQPAMVQHGTILDELKYEAKVWEAQDWKLYVERKELRDAIGAA